MKKLIVGCLLLAAQSTQAQQVQYSGWLASFNTISLKGKWTLHTDLQWRSTNHVAQVQTMLARVGLNYQVRRNHVATAGYAYIPNRYKAGVVDGLVPEHRLWQQYIINQSLSKTVALQHRFRLEERWIPNVAAVGNEVEKTGSRFATRFRYFNRAVIPLRKQSGAFSKGLFASVQNEVFINTTHRSHINGRWFDQNRLYMAVGYRLSKRADLETGYLNQYLKAAGNNANTVNHIWQLAVYTRL
ncbi:MAG: DUF2490 domain-containing protein [Chitinophagaceae bacterium]|nr:DUF2490 domain-containing protein [Chitinophagaceae bacterium]